MSYMRKITQKADDLASRYWDLAASDRKEAYRKWLDCLKAATIEVKKNKLHGNYGKNQAARGAKRGSSQKLTENPLNLSTKFSK